MDATQELEILKRFFLYLSTITIVHLILLCLLVLDKFNLFRKCKRSANCGVDLKNYANLPIPKMTKNLTLDQKWFTLYEKVMGTKDDQILKLALMYYVDAAMENKLFSLINESTYEEIKSKFTYSYQI